MTDTLTRPESIVEARGSNALAGTGTLIRFMLRRDRVRLPLWILAITGFTLASVAALPDLYASGSDRQARATLMQNPGTRAISGPGYGLDDYTFGAMVSLEFLSWAAIFVALMSIFTVVRHTRTEEETGRAELVRSSRVGRHASITAALAVTVGANVVLAVLLGLGLGSLGVESVGLQSSMLFGVALASVGIVFAGVAAVTVQLNEYSRGASGLAGFAFAAVYLLRAAGDMAEVGGGVASWLSPIGWAQQTRVYVDDRWWPLLLSLGLTVILLAVAYWLSNRRDVGASLVASRPGPAHAAAGLSSPLGLAWRLHRSTVAWWSLAMVLLAYGYGTLASEVERFVTEMSVIQDAVSDIGGTTIDAWISVIMLVFAVLGAVFAVLITLRARSEETSGRAEPLLATAVSRSRWFGSHLAVAFGGSASIMLLGGIGLGLSASQALGDADLLGPVVAAALAHIPAVWLMVGVATALYGLVPRATSLAWLVVTYAGLVGWLGVLLGFPQWAINLSPLGHTPLLPAEDMRWIPLVGALAGAIVLVALGLLGLRRRDLQTTA